MSSPSIKSSPKTLSPNGVCQLIQKNCDDYIGVLLVEGEVSSLAAAASGHYYFQLKDDKAVLKSVIWRYRAKAGGANLLSDGAQVLAKGTLSVYGPRSEYQLIVETVELKGAGALRRAFEKLKKLLEAEGLFSEERKRPLPPFPRRVALISSYGSAAANDFMLKAARRYPLAWVSLFHSLVQGQGAAEEIASVIESVNLRPDFDLIVITRGGGSLEDLWSFNEEVLVRAVAASRVPILAAIGHSTDESLVEIAADAKAITPTAAAEAAFPDWADLRNLFFNSRRNLLTSLASLLSFKNAAVESYNNRLSRFGERLLTNASQTLYRLETTLERNFRERLNNLANLLNQYASRLERASPFKERQRKNQELQSLSKTLLKAYDRHLRNKKNALAPFISQQNLSAKTFRWLKQKKMSLEQVSDSLNLVSPLKILSRGYAIVVDSKGTLVRSSTQVAEGQKLKITLAAGRLESQVTKRYD
ncbi:MAG: exodeoxyribonuclease VII large subunit [Deltaproteobacteria bacterium]|jgi:exodeoxyribonuclease VII large subunit|nr:exodeoxyribonuclease VII large subunit [Deltaproteobacteria bacterium]